MRAGNLKHTITIQRYTSTQNEVGEVIENWEDLFTTRAEIKPLVGKEFFIGQIPISEMSHKITLRYKELIKTSDRVAFNDRYFDITSVANINERNRVIEILAKERN